MFARSILAAWAPYSEHLSHGSSSLLDPNCEMSVGDENRLKRWLSLSIPSTIQSLRDPKPIRKNILKFAEEQGIDPKQTFGSLLYSEGGVL